MQNRSEQVSTVLRTGQTSHLKHCVHATVSGQYSQGKTEVRERVSPGTTNQIWVINPAKEKLGEYQNRQVRDGLLELA